MFEFYVAIFPKGWRFFSMSRLTFLFSFLSLASLVLVLMSSPLFYVQANVIDSSFVNDKQNNLITGLSITQKSQNQGYKRFHLLGYQKKQTRTMSNFTFGYERKKIGKIFFRMDAGIGVGASEITLSDENGKSIGDGQMGTESLEGNILTGYTFLVANRLIVTPYVGFSYFDQNDESKNTVLKYDNKHDPKETYFYTYRTMALIGLRLENEFSNRILGGLDFRFKKSLRSSTIGSIGLKEVFYTLESRLGRTVSGQKVTALQIDVPFSYRYAEKHLVIIAPSYQYISMNETFLTSRSSEHDIGLSVGYNYRF